MRDAFFVCGGETERHLPAEVQRPGQGKRAVGELFTERMAFQPLDHGIRDSVLVAEVVDRQNVRMGQRGNRARLSLEARAILGTRAGHARQDLDGHVAPKHQVACPIDFAHAAGAHGGDHFVAVDSESRGELHAASCGDVQERSHAAMNLEFG